MLKLEDKYSGVDWSKFERMLNEKNRIVRCAKIRERNQSIC